eukprot:COSAG03_NODE_18440_length_355_cov_0.605469_1_plen_104_part_01
MKFDQAENPARAEEVIASEDSEEDESGGAGLSSQNMNLAARAVFAHLSEAPVNHHQATVFFLSSTAAEDGQMRRHGPLLFAISLLMVVVQCLTAGGVAKASNAV